MRCDRCPTPSVTLVPYAGTHLCAEHFLRFVEKRVRSEVRAQFAGLREATIGVATSGGKDSLALLHLLHRILGDRRGHELVAITVDEGIAGYRARGVAAAAALARRLGVRHEIASHEKDHGVTTDALVLANPGIAPCASCGVLRRKSLNEAALRSGCDVLATGHNLDDLAQTVLMNVVRADVDRLGRLGPHTGRPRAGLVPRVFPLRTIPEREVALYAVLEDLGASFDECPHSRDADRSTFRDLLLALEAKEPGTRHRLLSFHDAVVPVLRAASGPMRRCARCGGPTSGERCRACALLATPSRSSG